MADLFLSRLEESLNSFEEDEVNLTMVASSVVTKYYDEDKDVMKTMDRMRQVERELDNKEILLWTILCSQVLVLRCAKSSGDMEGAKKIAKGINETLEKFDDIAEYTPDTPPVKN